MLTRITRPIALSMLFTAALIISATGCSNNATTPSDSFARNPTFIYRGGPNAKPAEGEEEAVSDSVPVFSSTGTYLPVGDEEIGTSSIDIPGGAIDADDDGKSVNLVKVKVNRIGMVSAELRPHGMRFHRPVMLRLSYKGANLTDVNEDALVILYENEEDGVWEKVDGSVVDKVGQSVSAPLNHFSRYAIGSDE